MAKFLLKLIPEYRSQNTVLVELVEKSDFKTGIETDINLDRYVMADQSYSAELCGDEVELIENIVFFVNDFPVNQFFDRGKIIFRDSQFPRAAIFMDSFGYIQICVQITLNGCTQSYYSKYISVLVKNDSISQSVQRMAEFVYNYHEPFLRGKKMSSCCKSGLKEDSPQMLDTKIKLLRSIIEQYEINYGFFRTGSKSKVQLEGRLVDFEKAQFFDNTSIMRIASNPMYLRPTTSAAGIKVQKAKYMPTKVYSKTGELSFDIYENRVIVGFLRTLESEVSSLLAEVTKRLDHFPTGKEVIGEYFASAGFIYEVTKHHLECYKSDLKKALLKISELYAMYADLLKVADFKVDAPPKPSATFLSIHHYRVLYEKIIAWFQYGIYDFARENFMLPFIQMHKLYECYVLVKMLQCLEQAGFELIYRNYYSYSEHTVYDEPENYNTFVFSGGSRKISVYYEPIIHDGSNTSENGVGLFRNTSISVPKQWQIDNISNGGVAGNSSGHYYCPDYVIKTEQDGIISYIILDAKFSRFDVVRNIYFPALAYKYLFSLSTTEENSKISGLCLIHGKSFKTHDQIQSMYDLTPTAKTIEPFAKILTLTENESDCVAHHCHLLSELLEL